MIRNVHLIRSSQVPVTRILTITISRHKLGLVLVTQLHNLVKRLVTGTSHRPLVIQQLLNREDQTEADISLHPHNGDRPLTSPLPVGIQQPQEPPASKGTPSDLRQEGGVMIFTVHSKLPLATKHARAVIIVQEATTTSQIHRTCQAPVINITGQTLI